MPPLGFSLHLLHTHKVINPISEFTSKRRLCHDRGLKALYRADRVSCRAHAANSQYLLTTAVCFEPSNADKSYNTRSTTFINTLYGQMYVNTYHTIDSPWPRARCFKSLHFSVRALIQAVRTWLYRDLPSIQDHFFINGDDDNSIFLYSIYSNNRKMYLNKIKN